MQKSLKIKKRGFTLIETLVAIMMVSIAFVGIYAAAAKYAQQTKQVKETYIASLLGQEGVEIVRNIRDYNWVKPSASWNTGLTSCACTGSPPTSGGCEAEYNYVNGTSSLTSYGTGRPFYITGGNSYYTYASSGNTLTNYKRRICIDSSTPNILHVVVYVYWTGGRLTVIKEDLYNWKW